VSAQELDLLLRVINKYMYGVEPEQVKASVDADGTRFVQLRL
jgi:hypothetical protein